MSETSLNVEEASETIIRMVLNINISKRKFVFEYDIDRESDDDGMMDQESHTQGQNSNLYNDG